ncbi:ATP-binding cassette subfamily B protein [Natranaerovirga hydrolytica]|uniref:ATP-binding cassette subfamily B protein n=1 Tax=Natranaerovirga hydrolytica TaxID=680378 RepID=A0A4R1N158_9FIRM|nr:ABC transporter ATP-binding protein [Natranaerovirga hydrolytica]TCK97724.1 ATP-binding cassette subfamily B protein [Natranaerovirga hydrolytica]
MSNEEQKQKYFEDLFINGNKSRFKTFISLYRGNYGKLGIALIYYLIKHLPTWILPIVTANIITIISSQSEDDFSSLLINFILVIVLLLQNIPFNALHTKQVSLCVRYVEAGLRSSLVRKLQQLSIGYHQELKSGKLQSKVLRDVEAIEFLSRQTMLTLIPIIINVMVSIVIISFRSLLVATFFVFLIPIATILITAFKKNIKKGNNEFRKEIETMSSKVSEMVQMIPITRAHGLENIEINKIDHQLEKVEKKGFKLDMITAYFGACSWVSFQIFSVVCLMFTAYLAYNGNIPVGDIVLYQTYFTTIINQISNMANIYPNIAKGFESIDSVTEILLVNDIEKNNGKKKLKNIKGQFVFDHVSFNYGNNNDEDVIKGFDLRVNEGETIAFVGESGAGKSTLLNLIVGFCQPTEGNILIDDYNMNEIDFRSFRKYISVVPQNNILFSGTIRDNIMYGIPNIKEEEIKKVIQLSNLETFINEFPNGLDTMVGEQGNTLSGGQKQRIAIARAMIRNPKIILLDEATSALDNISEYKVQKAMKALVKNRTTFIVAHRLSTIRDADRIIVMKKGSCVEKGTYEELIKKKGEFYNMQKLQA